MIVLKEQKVARNPVARAVAAQQLKKRMIDHRIQLFLLHEGDNAAEHILPISDAIFVMAYALGEAGEEDSVDHRKLRSAMLVLVDCSKRGFTWRKSEAITIDNAIDICVNRWRSIHPDILQEAIAHISNTMK